METPAVVGPVPARWSLYVQYPGATKCFVNGLKHLWFIPELLAAHSDPFDRMFFGEYEEKDKVEIPLSEDEFEGMEHILRLWLPIPTTVAMNDQNIEFIFPVAKKYLMIDLMEKCEAYLMTGVGQNDFALALTGFCTGIRCEISSLVNHCLPLCVWRKDLFEHLATKDVCVPERLMTFLTRCVNCDFLPWNVNWQVVYTATRKDAGIDQCRSFGFCYKCSMRLPADVERRKRCAMCTRDVCSQCFANRSPSVCLQYNFKRAFGEGVTAHCCAESTTGTCLALRRECICCTDSVCPKCFHLHSLHCGNLKEVVSDCLKLNGFMFSQVDWFKS